MVNRTTVAVSRETHDKLKLIAERDSRTISGVVAVLVRDDLAAHANGKGVGNSKASQSSLNEEPVSPDRDMSSAPSAPTESEPVNGERGSDHDADSDKSESSVIETAAHQGGSDTDRGPESGGGRT